MGHLAYCQGHHVALLIEGNAANPLTPRIRTEVFLESGFCEIGSTLHRNRTAEQTKILPHFQKKVVELPTTSGNLKAHPHELCFLNVQWIRTIEHLAEKVRCNLVFKGEAEAASRLDLRQLLTGDRLLRLLQSSLLCRWLLRCNSLCRLFYSSCRSFLCRFFSHTFSLGKWASDSLQGGNIANRPHRTGLTDRPFPGLQPSCQ